MKTWFCGDTQCWVDKNNGKIIPSSWYVKFPFKPKTFYIDVIETEDGSFIKDQKQLNKVKKYYKEPKI